MRTFTMVFKNKQLLNSMLELRRRGWTYESLGIIFKVDHSSIYKACKIRGIGNPKIPLSIDFQNIIQSIGINTPHEKTYQDYLKEEKYRRFPNLRKLETTVV